MHRRSHAYGTREASANGRAQRAYRRACVDPLGRLGSVRDRRRPLLADRRVRTRCARPLRGRACVHVRGICFVTCCWGRPPVALTAGTCAATEPSRTAASLAGSCHPSSRCGPRAPQSSGNSSSSRWKRVVSHGPSPPALRDSSTALARSTLPSWYSRSTCSWSWLVAAQCTTRQDGPNSPRDTEGYMLDTRW